MGVIVYTLKSRSSLCSILTVLFLFGASACSDPDERMPWPTAQEESLEMPVETLGLWKSPCIPIGEDGSRFFELQVNHSGKFKAVEHIFFNNVGCLGVVDRRRTRNGQVDERKDLGDKTWKFTAHMDEHDSPGDLMDAEFLIKIIDGKTHLRPVCANLFDLGDQIHRVWEDTDTQTWILEQLDQ